MSLARNTGMDIGALRSNGSQAPAGLYILDPGRACSEASVLTSPHCSSLAGIPACVSAPILPFRYDTPCPTSPTTPKHPHLHLS